MSNLFDAIRSGDAAAVRSLIDADPALLSARQNNVSPVMWAIYNGKSEVARLLASRTALTFHEACAVGDIERVRTMLDENPSLLNANAPDGFPPVGLAIFFRQPAVARLLIERGADVSAAADNPMRVAPVHAAAAACDRETMRLLLDRGADPNAKQQMDYTPLHGAASRGDVEMAKVLIARGADRNARGSDGKTVAQVAIEHGHPEFAEWLSA